MNRAYTYNPGINRITAVSTAVIAISRAGIF